MAEDPVVVAHERLAEFIVSVLEALKMSPKNARLTADLMVRTDLRGVDSHGIGMLPKYVEWTRAGFVHPWADPVVARDDLATALVDGQKGLGHPASAMAMELAISKAATYGIGIVAVRNSTSSASGPWRSSRPTWTTCWARYRICRQRTGTSASTLPASPRRRRSDTVASPAFP